jgi:hypothetical protein
VREAEALYRDTRSALARPPTEGRDVLLYMPLGRPPSPSTVADSTERGSDSRDAPKMEDGASARTDASVSRLWRRRRFEEEARVRMEALSVRMLFAVAA